PGLRPRHAVRPAERRAHRVDPDEPAATGALGIRLRARARQRRGAPGPAPGAARLAGPGARLRARSRLIRISRGTGETGPAAPDMGMPAARHADAGRRAWHAMREPEIRSPANQGEVGGAGERRLGEEPPFQ